jgi:hypothetical protein
MNSSQFGFIPGVSIEEAKMKVFKEMQRLLNKHDGGKKNRPRAIFIYYKFAYDSVSWNKLYKILEEKKNITSRHNQTTKIHPL